MVSEKLPPHNIEAEQSVLGALLVDSRAISNIVTTLTVDDFYRESHAMIYKAMLALNQRGEPTGQIGVAQELEVEDQLNNSGGHAYLAHLIEITPNAVHVAHYAKIVRRLSIMRQLIETADQISDIGFEGDANVDEAIRRSEELLFAIRDKSDSRDFIHLEKALDPYLDRSLRATQPSGIMSKFTDLDSYLGGLHKSDMVVLAARPSIGKSMVALNLALNVAEQGKKVAIFSLEMGIDQVATRLLACHAQVSAYKIRTRRTSQAEDDRIIHAVGALSDYKIYVDDTPTQSVPMMVSKARQLHLDGELDFIIVDYMQLIEVGRSGSRSGSNRVQEVSEISRQLKAMARDFDVPVLAVSQLSRALEQRDNKRPILSDLRDSGSIEQDADVVIFIHRQDRYISQEDWEKQNPKREYPRNIAELIIAKHRNGPTGEVQLVVNDELGRLASAAPQYQQVREAEYANQR